MNRLTSNPLSFFEMECTPFEFPPPGGMKPFHKAREECICSKKISFVAHRGKTFSGLRSLDEVKATGEEELLPHTQRQNFSLGGDKGHLALDERDGKLISLFPPPSTALTLEVGRLLEKVPIFRSLPI